jgi:hypothetical protein
MPASDPTLYQKIAAFVQTVIIPVCVETLRQLPDSVVLGTALLAMISLCKSYGVLVLAMVEMMLIQRVAASGVGSISPLGAGHDALHQSCQPGMAFANNMRISLLETIGKASFFPSPTMFFLAGTVSYMIAAVKQFEREINALGGDLNTRTTVGLVLSSFFVFIMLVFRYSYGCETFETLLMSLILGSVAGILVMYQNKALFGREGLNILNLPMIKTADESSKPMFVCAPSK